MPEHPLKAKRTECGLSQDEQSALVDVSKPFISAIERGERSPGMVTLKKLAFALHTRPEEICPDVVAKYRKQADLLSA